MDHDELKKILVTLSPGQICTLAARCALRVMPVLSYQGVRFPFWGDKSPEMLFALFRACNACIALHDQNIVNLAADAANAADSASKAAEDAAAKTANAAAVKAVAKANAAAANAAMNTTADFAYVNASASAIAYVAYTEAAVSAYHAANAAACSADADAVADAAESAYSNAYSAAYRAAIIDISCLTGKSGETNWPDLWHGKSPENQKRLEKDFLSGLSLLKLDYWADCYSSWVLGRFDWEKLERCLFMPKETINAGPKAMLIYLQTDWSRWRKRAGN
jgi:hypothetical protein